MNEQADHFQRLGLDENWFYQTVSQYTHTAYVIVYSSNTI